MLINSIKLKNIRSYLDETITFSEGSSLLAGDIGSGKTTILLAIEFAIFGILKGVYSGNTLLRHGSSNGSVELNLIIDKKQVTIKRSLKRTSVGINQDSGILIINNEVFEGTPQELKSRILEILGYPESLLSKSKSLIFRYTVFTPQEEMKKIIYESKEERLDILRKLFNLDKYKRIKENSSTYAKEIRTVSSYIEGKIERLPNLKQEVTNINQNLKSINQELVEAQNNSNQTKAQLSEQLKVLEILEQDYDKVKTIENELKLTQSKLNLLKSQNLIQEKDNLSKEINSNLTELGGFDPTRSNENKSKMDYKQEELNKAKEKLTEIITKRSDYKSRQNLSSEVLNKIQSIDTCPTCLQKVSENHIESVKSRENQIIHTCKLNVEKLNEIEANIKKRKDDLEAELNIYAKSEQEFKLKKYKFENLEKNKLKLAQLEKKIEETNHQINLLNKQLSELHAEFEKNKHIKDSILKQKQILEEKQIQNLRAESKLTEKNTNKVNLNNQILKLEQEIANLEKEEKHLIKLKEQKSWLENDFIGTIDLIEKSVLAKVHNEFNNFFQSWFNMLLEDETVNVRLDEYFSPIIDQNGYETTIDNLSGGEKTSVALAYRLALNRVVNDFLSTVKTQDLIILDEPTEGFSTDQLDRLKEVLEQTKSKQIIIVSHETKMEGFVENVIRISKKNHESQIQKL